MLVLMVSSIRLHFIEKLKTFSFAVTVTFFSLCVFSASYHLHFFLSIIVLT